MLFSIFVLRVWIETMYFLFEKQALIVFFLLRVIGVKRVYIIKNVELNYV